MKVVALHTDFRIYWPARLSALSRVLESRGDKFDVIEIAGKGSPYAFAEKGETNGMHWHVLFPDSKPEDLAGKVIKEELFRLLDRLNPDVVIAGAIAFPSGALATQWANSRSGKRVVIFDDAKAEAVKRNPVVNFVKQCVYDGVDALFLPAEPWQATGEGWGIGADRQFYGVDVVDNDFWGDRGQNNQINRFIVVGRQIPKKKHVEILKAYTLYKEAIREVPYSLLIVGDGPENSKVKDLVDAEKLHSAIEMKSFVDQETLRSLYHESSALILNSDEAETWGLVINEAMCGGCAVIASRQCGATDVLVKDGVNGYVTSCDDIEGLADAMLRYHQLSDSDKQLMAQKSKEIIADWGLDRFCRGAVAACDYVTNNPKRKPSFLARLIINKWHGQYRPV